jgi:hypothetical protein
MKYRTRTTNSKKKSFVRKSKSVANYLSAENETDPGTSSHPQLSLNVIMQSRGQASEHKNLRSKRFKGFRELEMAYNDKFLIFNGQAGRFVRVIQEALMDFGFDLPKYKNDGIFGDETEKAVREFQWASSAVLIDGLIGPETMGLLDDWAINREKKEDREQKQKERKNEKEVIKKSKEVLKEKEESLVPSPGTIEKVETNRIAQEVIFMYFRYKRGEKIKDNFLSKEQVRLFFLLDMGDPKNGSNPHYKSNVDKAATNFAFEQLERKLDPDKDIDKQVEEFVYTAERIAREMNGGFELFKSKGPGFGSHIETKDYEKLKSYFQYRTANCHDIYFSVTHE